MTMGLGSSKHYLEDISDSETDSEDEYTTTDARARTASTMLNPEDSVSIEVLDNIQKDLAEYEIVSLIFLLKNVEGARNALQKILTSPHSLHLVGEEILTDWALEENTKKSKWQLKLIEALCIIQNYKILAQLGYKNKTDLKMRFYPRNGNLTECVGKTQKTLYLIAEEFDEEKALLFLNLIQKEFAQKGIPFYNNAWNQKYLELYFLDWEWSTNYLKILVIMKSVLKQMNKEVLADNLGLRIEEEARNEQNRQLELRQTTVAQPFSTQEVYPIPNQKVADNINNVTTRIQDIITATRGKDQTFRDAVHQGYSDGGQFDDQPSISNSSIYTVKRDSDNCYPIRTDKPGKMLIIDQKDFYTEPDPKYATLLFKNNNEYKLTTRYGTEKDTNRLVDVFQNKFKFKVIVEPNLSHYTMIQTIDAFLDSITDESSVFICILSHGEKGVVFGCNSCFVPVEKIEKIIRNKPNLKGKPKVLILQACQGFNCQKEEIDYSSEDEDASLYTRDGGVGPKTADVLKFWATVPGYAAVRNQVRGSWFIQELCDAIEKYHQQDHFLDICTRVNNMVSNKKWREDNGTNIMMPILASTFRKQFYFPE